MTTTALVPRGGYPKTPDLVAWYGPQGLSLWHISAGSQTRCGESIPPQGMRYTRRHHPSAIVCRKCVDGKPGIAVADAPPRVLDLMAALRESLKQHPAAADTATGHGSDAVEPGVSANLDSARRGHNA